MRNICFKKISGLLLVLSVFIGVHRWLTGVAFAGTPVPDNAFDAVASELEKAKAETQKLKDDWDKSRLETTLYEKRVKRAAQRFSKATKGLKAEAKEQKERAELEFQLALEKRKLAYNEWQAAQFRSLAKESQLKALGQERDGEAIRERIGKLEKKLEVDASETSGSKSK